VGTAAVPKITREAWMLGRWFFLAVVGIGLAVIVHGAKSGAGATITQSCAPAAPGVASVTFEWPAPELGAAGTTLELSLLPGFPAPLTNARGPFPPDQTSYTVDALPVGVTLHYRVRAIPAAGAASDVVSGSFKTKCDEPGAAASVTP
jgi:hypothetical protein